MKHLYRALVAGIVIVALASCSNPMRGGGGSPSPAPSNDIASWFEGIYLDLLDRERNGTMGAVATCQYVCNVINTKLGLSISPVPGTATDPANCEYLLKMIDQYVNQGISNYGTGQFATQQILDTTGVDRAVSMLTAKAVASHTTNKISYFDKNTKTWKPCIYPSNVYSLGASPPIYANHIYLLPIQGDTTLSNKNLLCSYDGITWDWVNLPSSIRLANIWDAIFYHSGKFLAIHRAYTMGNDQKTYCFTSTDGLNWSLTELPYTFPTHFGAYSGAWGNGKWVILGIKNNGSSSSAVMLSSYDEINWTETPSPANKLGTIEYVNGKFLYNDVSAPIRNYYSDDGINWSIINNPIPGTFVQAGAGKFIAGVMNTANAYYSTDLITWNQVTKPLKTHISDRVIYRNGKIISPAILGINQTGVSVSSDGINWDFYPLSPNYVANGMGAVFVDNQFIIGGGFLSSNASSWHSIDGANWTRVPLGSVSSWNLIRILD